MKPHGRRKLPRKGGEYDVDCESDAAGYRQRSTGVATFSHDPKEVHVKAARRTIDCLTATAHLGRTFWKDSKLLDAHLESHFRMYVEAGYTHKADDSRLVSGLPVCCGGTLESSFSRTHNCVILSTTEAEHVAMTDEVTEALYVRGVLVF